jgi:hypothetical protein
LRSPLTIFRSASSIYVNLYGKAAIVQSILKQKPNKFYFDR